MDYFVALQNSKKEGNLLLIQAISFQEDLTAIMKSRFLMKQLIASADNKVA